jgi:glycosyltransferase involved in cell wall biosynthesis
MDVTVILCTYNRCQSLSQALATIVVSELPNSVSWEVLVVDNNSTDQTRHVVEEFCRLNPGRVRYLFEPQQGLSRARNAGIREAHGKVIAFMDDDVTVDPGWLHTLTSNLHDGQWAGAGGRILPLWTSSPPRWLPLHDRYALAPIAMFDPKLEAGPLPEPPFGASMAFRKEMFAKYGDFRPDLGRCGSSMLSNEDTEFGNRLLKAGERLRYEPTAIVYHAVPENRIKKQYFLRWWFDKARADVREFGIPEGTRWFIAGVPLYMFRRLGAWAVRWMITAEPGQRFGAKVRVWGRLGEITECYWMAHGAPGRLQDHQST